MNDASKQQNLAEWLKTLNENPLPEWSDMPNLDLYMDQVLTYLERNASPLAHEGEKGLTPSMINNYVKAGVIPAPVKKKYNREHLSRLITIMYLKKVLSISDIKSLLGLFPPQSGADIYPLFHELDEKARKESVASVKERLKSIGGKEENEKDLALLRLTVEIALEASVRQAIAEQLITRLSEREHPRQAPRPVKATKDASEKEIDALLRNMEQADRAKDDKKEK